MTPCRGPQQRRFCAGWGGWLRASAVGRSPKTPTPGLKGRVLKKIWTAGPGSPANANLCICWGGGALACDIDIHVAQPPSAVLFRNLWTAGRGPPHMRSLHLLGLRCPRLRSWISVAQALLPVLFSLQVCCNHQPQTKDETKLPRFHLTATKKSATLC
jgi:hypothetical protein